MAIVIGQIITEVAVAPVASEAAAGGATPPDDAQVDIIVRRSVERVLETLRREWDR
jgi:hypothetical protein